MPWLTTSQCSQDERFCLGRLSPAVIAGCVGFRPSACAAVQPQPQPCVTGYTSLLGSGLDCDCSTPSAVISRCFLSEIQCHRETFWCSKQSGYQMPSLSLSVLYKCNKNINQKKKMGKFFPFPSALQSGSLHALWLPDI